MPLKVANFVHHLAKVVEEEIIVFSTGRNCHQPVGDTELMAASRGRGGNLTKCWHPNIHSPLPFEDATGGALLTWDSNIFPIICGGIMGRSSNNDEEYSRDCYRLRNPMTAVVATLTTERVGAASVVVRNGTTLWVTGGHNIYGYDQDSTDILGQVSAGSDPADMVMTTAPGVKLPRRMSHHCLVMLLGSMSSSSVILFGGSGGSDGSKDWSPPPTGMAWTMDLNDGPESTDMDGWLDPTGVHVDTKTKTQLWNFEACCRKRKGDRGRKASPCGCSWRRMGQSCPNY